MLPQGGPPTLSGQPSRSSKPAHPDHRALTAHAEQAKGDLLVGSSRHESVHSVHGASSVAALQPPNPTTRTLSAPILSRGHSHGTEEEEHVGSLGDHQDDWEIAGDEFFQRYHFPDAAIKPTKLDISSSSAESSSDTEGPLSPTNLKGRHPLQSDTLSSPRSPAPSVDSANSDSVMQEINVAVLGARGSGKSTFIRRALNLPNAGPGAVCTRKMTIDGGLYAVRFLEMSISDVQIRDRNCIEWPEAVDDMVTPRIDGAITIYDVTSDKSLARVPEVLGLLSRSGLPFILVGCKCDSHPAHREVDPAVVEKKAKTFLGEVDTFQTSEALPETHRRCLSVITRAVISSKRPRSQASMARRRANSSAVRSSTAKDSWDRKHERASSDISARLRPHSTEIKNHRYKPSETNKTFFNFEEESPSYNSNESAGETSDAEQSVAPSEMPSDENGYTFDQLVDRLLAQPMSKNDSKFVSMFLALYRKFATPGQLLGAILKRFDSLKRRSPPMLRIIAQLRYLAILQQWVSRYPGDFAYPTTRRTLRKFAMALSSNREFSVAAKEILLDYEAITEDDDTEWACSDRMRAQNEQIPTFHTVLDEDSESDEFTKALGNMSMPSDSMSIARSNTTGNSRSTTGTTSSTQTLLHQVEQNERIAKNLVPNPIKPLTKIQWRQLMEEPEEAIARELTRIDWIMFSSIRPRDLVRHVSMNDEQKKRFKSLENVTRMTDHFNHVAYLVGNYILLRDKHRHRALMLEKWMKVAREVRKLNNYNTLGAVLAGVRSTAVHRLAATKELVPQNTNKDFMKLEILMGPQKSHFAYRLAWDNSSGERLPYIPLHRRDLVTAADGNSTFISDKAKQLEVLSPHPGTSVFHGAAGNRNSREAPPSGITGKERINWKKFEIMGEVIVGVQRAQGTPYAIWRQNDAIKNLILDIKINTDEEDLYERSVQLEAAGAGEKKKFASWWRER